MKIKGSVCIDVQDDKMMVFDADNNYFIEINEMGKSIIEMIKNDNNISINGIVDKIEKEYECMIEHDEIFSDISEFVGGMLEIGVITEN